MTCALNAQYIAVKTTVPPLAFTVAAIAFVSQRSVGTVVFTVIY